jgi:hypothetical protein
LQIMSSRVSKNWATCPICMGIMKNPTILPDCGHSYCRVCIQGVLKVKHDDGHLYGLRRKVTKTHDYECPHCRVPFSMNSLKPNFMMQMALEEMDIKSDSEDEAEPSNALRARFCYFSGELYRYTNISERVCRSA